MRRIIEQSRVKRDTGARVYPPAREFVLDGAPSSTSVSIRCLRPEREAAFDATRDSNAAWLASHSVSVSASPSATRDQRQADARERHEKRLEAVRAVERARAIERAPEEIARAQTRRDVLQAERAAWSGVTS